jgi:NO-binding membrane sensor protein with MHYT domain
MVCCAGGIWLGLPAAVLGYLGMRNVDNHPDRYSGRGLAIAGLVLGIVTFLASVVFLLFSAVS